MTEALNANDLARTGWKYEGEQFSRLSTLGDTCCRPSKIMRRLDKDAAEQVLATGDRGLAERFFRKAFKVLDGSTPDVARLLDAKVLAAKIAPNGIKPALIEKQLVDNPDLHRFLSGVKFHSQIKRYRSQEYPAPEVRIEKEEIALKFEGRYQRWSELADRVVYGDEGPDNAILVRTRGSSSAKGQLMSHSLTYDGFVRHPDRSKLHLTPDTDYLRLAAEHFVTAEKLADPPWGKRWVLRPVVDARTDKMVQREHGYFQILTPDGRRIVIGRQRESFGFELQPGWMAEVDPRFYRHFSGNAKPIYADIELTPDDLPKVFGFFIEEGKKGLYEQLDGNCVSDQEKLMNLLGYKWETKTSILNYKLSVIPSGTDALSSVVRGGLGLVANAYLYMKGGGEVRRSLKDRGIYEDRRLFQTVSDLFDPSKAMVSSGYLSGKRCEEINAFRTELGEKGKYLLPPEMIVDEDKRFIMEPKVQGAKGEFVV